MTLRESLEFILSEYPQAMSEAFKGHYLASFIRSEVRATVASLLGTNERYEVDASAGKGTWAKAPWIAIFDTLITDTAQSGYYPVYLFREDFSGFYLSLNQGVTGFREKYQSSAKDVLRLRATDFRAQIGNITGSFPDKEINLIPSSKNSFSAYYEAGNICAKYYDVKAIPLEQELIADLHDLLKLYETLSHNETIPLNLTWLEEDENEYIEDLQLFRSHKRIERNTRLVKAVKRSQGSICQVCKTDFEKIYGEIGRGYIEAHHLTPLAELKGQKISLNPWKDFAVLCANCHRMIHRSQFPHDIEYFKKEYYLPLCKI